MRERSTAMAESPSQHRFSIEDYHRMGDAGIFQEGDRVELIEGVVVQMTPIGLRHSAVVMRLNRLFARLGDRALLLVQGPVQFEDSEPEPDLALLAPEPGCYESRRPGAADALLIVEVADSSRRYDLEVKGPLYAKYGVPEYWVIDLEANRIEIFRRPDCGEYGERLTAARGDRLAPSFFPDFEFAADEIL